MTGNDKIQFQTEVIEKCLTESCSDCTGCYISELLAKRFICRCRCHDASLGKGEDQ